MTQYKDNQPDMADGTIIELYWQRDERAIRETEAKYGTMLFRICYNILHDRQDCEECKNDTYLGVWQAIPPTRPTVFPAFLTRIMRNIATKRYRERTSQKRIPSELTVSMDDLYESLHDDRTPESDYAASELARYISDYLMTLSERQRYVFIGRFYMVETMEHLAERLQVGVGTVHRDIERIKKGLRSYLEEKGVYV